MRNLIEESEYGCSDTLTEVKTGLRQSTTIETQDSLSSASDLRKECYSNKSYIVIPTAHRALSLNQHRSSQA